jgi:hypothetical protein
MRRYYAVICLRLHNRDTLPPVHEIFKLPHHLWIHLERPREARKESESVTQLRIEPGTFCRQLRELTATLTRSM